MRAMSLESRPEDYQHYLALPVEERHAWLMARFLEFDAHHFEKDPLIRGGDLCLRGTRLTPQEVLDIERDGELADYPHITEEQVAACRQWSETRGCRANDLIRYSPIKQPIFGGVVVKEWNDISFDAVAETQSQIWGNLV
jgi:uncharacterized protein (DUF433 family)